MMTTAHEQNQSGFSPLRLWILVLLACLVGCGGGLSQADMKKMGIRRKKDEETPAAATAASKPQPVASAKTATNDAQLDDSAAAEQPAEVAAQESRPAAAPRVTEAQLSDTEQKPAQPLAFEHRSLKSIQNMERIVAALEAYRADKGKYPVRASFGPAKAPLLSWRVELLPYLGYQQLYDAFAQDQPWNSAANKALLANIPAVYQSPERFDTKTNYHIAVGTSTIFGKSKTVPIRRIEDGVEHTLLLLETDDNLACAWTKPQDYDFDAREPKQHLGRLRRDSVFVGFGEGLVGAVPLSLADSQFKAMFSVDGGEAFSAYSVTMPVDDEYFANLAPAEEVDTSMSLTVSQSGSPRASQVRHVASASPLAKEYQESARLAYSMYDTGNAMLWMYASNLLQPPSAAWDKSYHWIPALQRPAQTIHFCVGVRKSARTPGRTGQAARSRSGRRNQSPERGQVVGHIAQVGESLLEVLEDHAAKLIPSNFEGLEASTNPGNRLPGRTPQEPQPILPVTYLGLGSRSLLTSEAVELAGDVLVLFDADLDAAGGKRWVSCELIDLARGQRLLGIPRIYWSNDTAIDEFLARDDAYKQKLWLLKDMLADELTFADWPAGLKPRHIEARLQKLANLPTLNPLIALSEMCVYRNRKLIDTQQLLEGYRLFLGENEGEALLLGSEKKKKRILRDWLPAVEPSELQQLAQRQQRSNRDDDD